MVKIILPEPGGSYFCETCSREYEKEGICVCGGNITFISMHSNRYLDAWMKSKSNGDKNMDKEIVDIMAGKF